MGTDKQNIEFSSTNLANAFNNAIGGNLYLGIKTDQEGTANRSFTFFQSTEDPSKPTLSSSTTNLPTITVSVPDDSTSEPGPDTATFTLDRGSATNSAVTVLLHLWGHGHARQRLHRVRIGLRDICRWRQHHQCRGFRSQRRGRRAAGDRHSYPHARRRL